MVLGFRVSKHSALSILYGVRHMRVGLLLSLIIWGSLSLLLTGCFGPGGGGIRLESYRIDETKSTTKSNWKSWSCLFTDCEVNHGS